MKKFLKIMLAFAFMFTATLTAQAFETDVGINDQVDIYQMDNLTGFNYDVNCFEAIGTTEFIPDVILNSNVLSLQTITEAIKDNPYHSARDYLAFESWRSWQIDNDKKTKIVYILATNGSSGGMPGMWR